MRTAPNWDLRPVRAPPCLRPSQVAHTSTQPPPAGGSSVVNPSHPSFSQMFQGPQGFLVTAVFRQKPGQIPAFAPSSSGSGPGLLPRNYWANQPNHLGLSDGPKRGSVGPASVE